MINKSEERINKIKEMSLEAENQTIIAFFLGHNNEYLMYRGIKELLSIKLHDELDRFSNLYKTLILYRKNN